MDDTTPRLPGLSKLTEAELRERYALELGQDVPAELTTTAQLREAISAHRAGSEEATPTTLAAPSAGPGEVLAEKDGEQRMFTAEAWAVLKAANHYGWQQVADATPKPPML